MLLCVIYGFWRFEVFIIILLLEGCVCLMFGGGSWFVFLGIVLVDIVFEWIMEVII